jgi:hypothetical protein
MFEMTLQRKRLSSKISATPFSLPVSQSTVVKQKKAEFSLFGLFDHKGTDHRDASVIAGEKVCFFCVVTTLFLILFCLDLFN